MYKDIIVSYIFPKLDSKSKAKIKLLNKQFLELEITEKNPLEQQRKQRLTRLKKYNPLWILISALPDKNWFWPAIFANYNTTYENLLEYHYSQPLNVDWKSYSKNPNLNTTIIKNHIGEWDYEYIFLQSCITENFIIENKDFICFEN